MDFLAKAPSEWTDEECYRWEKHVLQNSRLWTFQRCEVSRFESSDVVITHPDGDAVECTWVLTPLQARWLRDSLDQALN